MERKMNWIKPVVITLFAAMIVLNGYQVYRIAFVRHEADFVACLAGAEDFRNGTNPYLPTAVAPYNTLENYRPYIYPLFFAWLWVPFTFLPPIVASFTWFFLSVAMMFYALALCAELVGLTTQREQWLIFGIISLLFVSVFQWVLMFGHEDLFILLLLLLATKNLMKNRSRGGWFLGAAISGKLMPIVVLPMLIKSWKAMAICLVSIIVFCVIIPYLFLGNAIFHFYDYWIHDTLTNEMAKGDESTHSFALAGVVAQYMGLLRPTFLIKVVCGLLLISFPVTLLFKQKMLPALFLSFMLIPLTSTRSEPNHLTMLVPAVMLLASMLLKRKMMWHNKEIMLTTRNAAIGWAMLVITQMMILWGYNAVVPLDTIGMLIVFELVFMIGIQMKRPEIA
jgi:Glycosyltransferase family 87